MDFRDFPSKLRVPDGTVNEKIRASGHGHRRGAHFGIDFLEDIPYHSDS
jgi:hypothetical protein